MNIKARISAGIIAIGMVSIFGSVVVAAAQSHATFPVTTPMTPGAYPTVPVPEQTIPVPCPTVSVPVPTVTAPLPTVTATIPDDRRPPVPAQRIPPRR